MSKSLTQLHLQRSFNKVTFSWPFFGGSHNSTQHNYYHWLCCYIVLFMSLVVMLYFLLERLPAYFSNTVSGMQQTELFNDNNNGYNS